MKRLLHDLVAILALLVLVVVIGVGQNSGPQYRRSAVMNGNQVRTVFGNWGVIGQPIDTRPRGAWKNDNNGYLGDVSPFFGARGRRSIPSKRARFLALPRVTINRRAANNGQWNPLEDILPRRPIKALR
jgi:hypothetical protein